MMLFHYAPCSRLTDIVNSGHLRPSNVGAPSEKPLLWFSTNQQWEPTATKVLNTPNGLKALSFQEQACQFGCIRFGNDEANMRLMPWKQACDSGGIRRDARRAMVLYGHKRGAKPDQWFAVRTTVPLADLTFEIWSCSRWNRAEPKDIATEVLGCNGWQSRQPNYGTSCDINVREHDVVAQ